MEMEIVKAIKAKATGKNNSYVKSNSYGNAMAVEMAMAMAVEMAIKVKQPKVKIFRIM